ncbi:hypothetical protein DPMN_143689 [Dreissena polymorpha]|uniref:Secreted protein n=1 Tax=Dreissena polymorpha TaxID=45954 RepID=A0A9D4JPJ4_DREPO|nr:hypothetical protein DPMN_143689 [Dreissena polymorpha]
MWRMLLIFSLSDSDAAAWMFSFWEAFCVRQYKKLWAQCSIVLRSYLPVPVRRNSHYFVADRSSSYLPVLDRSGSVVRSYRFV